MSDLAARTRRAWARGMLVAVGGIDGSGKSTLIPSVAAWLRSQDLVVVETYQPTDFYRTGNVARAYQFGEGPKPPHEAMALISAGDRLLHLAETCIPRMEEGAVVLSHRFLRDTYAIFEARGVESDWLHAINAICPDAHACVLLDCPADVAVERIRLRGGAIRNDEKSVETLERIRRAYLRNADGHTCILDAREPQAIIHERAIAYLRGVLPSFPHLARTVTAP